MLIRKFVINPAKMNFSKLVVLSFHNFSFETISRFLNKKYIIQPVTTQTKLNSTIGVQKYISTPIALFSLKV